MIKMELKNSWSIESNLSGWHTLRLDGAKVLMSDDFDICVYRIKKVEKLSPEDIIYYDDIEAPVVYPTGYFKKD